jgi:hypothetical protein
VERWKGGSFEAHTLRFGSQNGWLKWRQKEAEPMTHFCHLLLPLLLHPQNPAQGLSLVTYLHSMFTLSTDKQSLQPQFEIEKDLS